MSPPTAAAPAPRWGLWAVLCWVLVMASAVAVVATTHRSRQLFDEWQQLRQEKNRLDIEWGRLLLERSTRASHARVEQWAREHGLRAPAPEDIRVIRP